MKIIEQENVTGIEVSKIHKDGLLLNQSGIGYFIIDKQGAKQLIGVLLELISDEN